MKVIFAETPELGEAEINLQLNNSRTVVEEAYQQSGMHKSVRHFSSREPSDNRQGIPTAADGKANMRLFQPSQTTGQLIYLP